ncbi:MAG: ribulose-phosphate 3-epimerase [Deltaproteobacteria bacterium]|uniref:Ribulose-phosphate 3-epimerase n=1 Tax=Candidatus Zymogenus saltonus TaxID=2844893 RepID=A0A9D8KCP0_9DELT|nr:ribulose-phosphate 3-epimerase [Candidatus Zymogenus saltonus]
MKKLIAPSILASDFSRLGEEINAVTAAGADWIHVDVMDGVFVPNISIGIPVVKSIRKVTNLPLDVHLMIAEPERYIEEFSSAGADIITIHQEATPHMDRSIMHIKSLGKRAGVSVNPGTPVTTIYDILGIVDMVLIMSVNPGYGGQKFIPYTLDKVRALKETLTERELDSVIIEIDGGITAETISGAAEAGVDVFVAGSSVFGANDYKKAIAGLKANI